MNLSLESESWAGVLGLHLESESSLLCESES